MKKLLLVGTIVLLTTWSANAQTNEYPDGVKQFIYARVVPSGVKRMLAFSYGAHPDCTPYEGIEVRLTKEPAHGKIEILKGESFPAFAKDSPRFKCNDKKLRGVLVNYTSEKNYTGEDTFEILVLLPTGLAQEAIYNVVVK